MRAEQAPSPRPESGGRTASPEVTRVRHVTSPAGGAVTSRAAGGVQEKLLCPACRASQDACSACQEGSTGGSDPTRGSVERVGWVAVQVGRLQKASWLG